MAKKRFYFVFIVLAVVFCTNSVVLAADSREIDVVFRKAKSAGGKIIASDKKVIDKFISISLNELVNAVDFKEMAEIRGEIVSRSIKKKPTQYSLAFSSALKKGLQPALANVAGVSDQSRKIQLKLNLLILLTQVESMELAPVGMSMVDDENAAVRYWAVSSVANSAISSQLKSKVIGDPKLVKQILSKFEKMINDKTLPEILNLIVGFADALDTPQADALLVRIADVRIELYAAWKVKFELMDAGLLNSLARSIKSGKTGSKKEIAEIARRFGQLYSYVMQRYILGIQTLDASQKAQLAFVLADVEQTSISKLLGQNQNQIKRLVSNSNPRSLVSLGNEHDSLLGNASRAGRLGSELNYHYGKPGSKQIIAPKRLSAPVISDK
ncbi:MAG: hypothetical protein FVQ82_03775 [Planctomycetes bacterium]|nr:hypothetical protein [Planctomycetota bacterium]